MVAIEVYITTVTLQLSCCVWLRGKVHSINGKEIFLDDPLHT